MTTIPADSNTAPRSYRKALTIAGSDSGGGAGIQADLKTFAALRCYGMSAITALTAQNTLGVTDIHPVPAAFVEAQLEAVFSDMGADAVKIGMLYSAELIAAVAGRLQKHGARRIVLDTVMISQSGHRLLRGDAVEAFKELLIPLADIITPNLPEAAVLLGAEHGELKDLRSAARSLSAFGSAAVLLKAGHLQNDPESNDILYLKQEDRFVELKAPRIDTRNNHGTGCTLSAAAAAYLAHGLDIPEAVRKAKEYIHAAIRAGVPYRLGKGHGPVHHLFPFWQ